MFENDHAAKDLRKRLSQETDPVQGMRLLRRLHHLYEKTRKWPECEEVLLEFASKSMTNGDVFGQAAAFLAIAQQRDRLGDTDGAREYAERYIRVWQRATKSDFDSALQSPASVFNIERYEIPRDLQEARAVTILATQKWIRGINRRAFLRLPVLRPTLGSVVAGIGIVLPAAVVLAVTGKAHSLLASDLSFGELSRRFVDHDLLGSLLAFSLFWLVLVAFSYLLAWSMSPKREVAARAAFILGVTGFIIGAGMYSSLYLGDLLWHLFNGS